VASGFELHQVAHIACALAVSTSAPIIQIASAAISATIDDRPVNLLTQQDSPRYWFLGKDTPVAKRFSS